MMPLLCNLKHSYKTYVHGGVPFLFCRQCGDIKLINLKKLQEEQEAEE